jgi:hypothetical protein
MTLHNPFSDLHGRGQNTGANTLSMRARQTELSA